MPLDAVSVLMQEAGSGATRLALNARKPVNPASLAKLLTTYAALDQLGPAFTWKTPVWLAGNVVPTAQGGVLEGHVHLQGRGDPKLTLERLWLLVQRLRQMGIAEIRGDIVLDQSAFAVPEGSTGAFDNEPLRPYNVRPQALLLNLNTVIYTFTPDVARGVALVSAEPALQGVQVDASVPLAAGPCNDWRGALKATLDDPDRMRFAGSYALACGERVWPLAYPDARLLRGAPAGHAVARGRRAPGRQRARGPGTRRRQAELRDHLAAAGRGGARHQQVQQQRDGAAVAADPRAAAPGRHARDPRGRARGTAQLARRAAGRIARRRGDRQRLGPVARDAPVRRSCWRACCRRRGQGR